VPRNQSLEDSILTWLSVPEEEEAEETTPAKPRVISMPGADANEGTMVGRKPRGTIRIKSQDPKQESA
jgi:hypothetical protein